MRELIVIVAEGCPGCNELAERLKRSKINAKVLDVTKSLEAARIVRDLGIIRVPTIVSVERTERGTELCTFDEENRVKCVEEKAE